MPETVIEITDVHKSFDGKPVHRGINLTVEKGEIITVMGRSGSGKSVLLKEINGLLKPDAGSVTVHGRNTVGLTEREMVETRKQIGMLFQGSALFDSLTVAENIAYPLIENLNLDKDGIKKVISRDLELVGLRGIEDKYPEELSGGMRKRVALARAIAIRPKILLYDEPTTGLDPPNIRRITDLIKRMRDRLNITAVVITHDIGAAFEVSDRVAFLHAGQIVFVGTAEEARSSVVPALKHFLSAKI